jgi:hypothetical protein
VSKNFRNLHSSNDDDRVPQRGKKLVRLKIKWKWKREETGENGTKQTTKNVDQRKFRLLSDSFKNKFCFDCDQFVGF